MSQCTLIMYNNNIEKIRKKRLKFSLAGVVHTCNPSYLESWDWEDWDSRPTLAMVVKGQSPK
jgi:hypothetical protein